MQHRAHHHAFLPFSHWFTDPTAGRVDLVVPINISPDPEPDAALLLDRTVDPKTGAPCYLIQRVLDLKWARSQARAIMQIDQDWLDAGIPGGVHAYAACAKSSHVEGGSSALIFAPVMLRALLLSFSTVFGDAPHGGPPMGIDPWYCQREESSLAHRGTGA